LLCLWGVIFIIISESSLNDFSDVKESYSGPNLMVGSPDDSASMMPSGAPSVNADKAGRLAFADFIDEAVDLPPQTYQKRVWKTAVFWSEINLYGHTIGTKQAAEAVEG
jgi:hypothetical protein